MRPLSLKLTIVVSMLVMLACGCMKNEGPGALDKPLRIAIDTKSYYDFLMGDFIEAAYPALKVEIIETDPENNYLPLDDYVELIRREKPDLIMTSDNRYQALAEAGLLADLSSRLAASGMKEEDFYDGAIDRAKQLGGGELLALMPDFSPSALYYNKTLFDKYGVEPPHSGMTLEEVFELGGRFVSAGGKKDGIVGLHQPYSNTPYDMLQQFGQNEGIRLFSYASGQMTMNTPRWKHIAETTADLYKLGVFSAGEVKGKMVNGVLTYDRDASMQANLFEAGKAAMTIGRYGITYNVGQDEIGYVGPPVSATDRTQSVNVYFFHYMSIGAEAVNADAAWDVIGFMVSGHMAKVLSKLSGGLSNGYDVHSSRAYMDEVHDPVLGELFHLKPIYQPSEREMADYDTQKLNTQLKERINQEMAALIDGSQSVDATLKRIEQEGNKLIEAAVKVKQDEPESTQQ